MSDLYLNHERDLLSRFDILGESLQKLTLLSQDKKKILLKEIQSQLENAKSDLNSMSMEDDGIENHNNRSQIRKYRGQLQSLQTRYGAEFQKYMTRKNEIMMGGDGVYNPQHRAKLLGNAQLLSDQNYQLQNAISTAKSTQDTGNQILGNLDENTQKLNKQNHIVIEIKSHVTSANYMINQMHKRNRRNKMILCFVAFVLIAMVVTVFYFSFIK